MRVPILVLVALATITVLITGFWDNLATTILPTTTWGLYSRDFFENVLVEVHGTVVDLLVVGVVLYWFDRRKTTKELIARHQEELADLRLYRAADAPYRTLGTIKRLMALGVTKFHLSEMTLASMEISGLRLVACNLHAVVLSNSRLIGIKLDGCNCDAAVFVGAKIENAALSGSTFKRAKFQDATLKGINFSSCIVEAADFTNANLRSANFSDVDCRGVSFKNADLRSANFIRARNLTPEMLALAKDIKHLKSDDPLLRSKVMSAKQRQ